MRVYVCVCVCAFACLCVCEYTHSHTHIGGIGAGDEVLMIVCAHKQSRITIKPNSFTSSHISIHFLSHPSSVLSQSSIISKLPGDCYMFLIRICTLPFCAKVAFTFYCQEILKCVCWKMCSKQQGSTIRFSQRPGFQHWAAQCRLTGAVSAVCLNCIFVSVCSKLK